MSATTLTLILFASMILVVLSGLPIAFGLAGVALVFIIWQLGPASLYLIASTAFSDWTNYIIVAIPLFILMANFLEVSGLADDLYEMMYRWMGGLNGGLAMGTVVICAIFAAISGVSAAATVTMGLVALPSMLKRRYDKLIAVGTVAAGGTLGILIPPSVIMVLYASLTDTSVGKLFMGGVFSGLALALIFIAYVGIRSALQPELGPALPKEERATWGEKVASLRAVVWPLALIILVLGVIYTGITTPTEASAIGAVGALALVLVRRRCTWEILTRALVRTLRLSCMTMWIILGAKLFSHVYYAIGAPKFVIGLISGLELDRWLIIVIMQLILIFLGMFIDPMGIMVITTPVFLPIVQALGFDLIWFGILFTINMEIGFITPPFGINLFLMKGILPPGITMGDLYKSIIPFAFLGMVGIALVMVFPQLALWLPSTMAR